MSVAPSHVDRMHLGQGSCLLADFDRDFAPMVASWVYSDRELFWLAPRTEPPLTSGKVIAWCTPASSPLLLWHNDENDPIGYAELNFMPGEKTHLWIGHCLIRPDRRGMGFGHRIVELLLREAFDRRRALAVSLVVFPDNAAAIRCYRTAGFVHVREQFKYMPATGRQHCMLEMRIRRPQYVPAHRPNT